MFMESNDWRFEGLKPQMDTDEHGWDERTADRFWSAAVLCRFRASWVYKSGRGLPHSKTLARSRARLALNA